MPVRQNDPIPTLNSANRVRRNSVKIESNDYNIGNNGKESESGCETDYLTDEQQKFQPAILCHDKKKVTLAVLEANAQK